MNETCICGKDGYPLNAISCPIHGDKRAAIASQIYYILDGMGAPVDLLSIIGSYGDTLEDSEVLQLLKDWNESGKILHERQ